MRAVSITVGADDVSNYVTRFSVIRPTLSVGKWTVIIRNTSGEWTGDFAVKDSVEIKIQDDDDVAATSILKGYLSISQPYYDLNHQQFMILAGKCRAAPLDWVWYSKKYVDTEGDDILKDLFDSVGELPQISFNNAGINTAAIDYEAREGVYYSTILREIGEMVDFDGYVDDSDALQFFSVGSQSSGVSLTDTTNILELNYTEADDINLRNYVKVEGSQIMDGWSDKNIAIYTAVGKALIDDTADKLIGESSLKGTVSAAGLVGATLDFTGGNIYNYSSIDVSKEGSRSVGWFAKHDEAAGYYNQYVELEDSNGDTIWYYGNNTINVWKDEWSWSEVTIGKDQHIAGAGTDCWKFTGGSTAFNWNIKKLTIATDDMLEDFHYWIDGICLPMNLISIKEDGDSQTAYDKRKLYIRRSDIKTQNELEDYATYILNKRLAPQGMLQITAKGNTSLHYPGKTVSVTSLNEGLNAKTCRIVELQHEYDALTPILPGHDYVTRLILDPQVTMVSEGKVLDAMRSPTSAELLKILDMAKALNKEYRRPIK